MDWRPRVQYNGVTVGAVFIGDVLDFTIPVRPWVPSSHAEAGDRDISATGVPAAYFVRRDELLDVTLRFYESEWPAVRLWLVWAQSQAAFNWLPDQLTPASSYSCYLHMPAMGEPIRPVRDSQFPLAYELDIQLRTVDGTPWTDIYFRED